MIFGISISDNSAEVKNKVIKFYFGNGKTAFGFLKVTANEIYSAEKGFGFVCKTLVQSVEKKRKNDLIDDFVTSINPFYFMVDLPEGNYEIKIGLGDPEGEYTLYFRKTEFLKTRFQN